MEGGEHTEERRGGGGRGAANVDRGRPTNYYMGSSIQRHVRDVALQSFRSCHSWRVHLSNERTVMTLSAQPCSLRRHPPPSTSMQRVCCPTLSHLMNPEASRNARECQYCALFLGRIPGSPSRDSIGISRGDLRPAPMPLEVRRLPPRHRPGTSSAQPQ